MPPSNAEAVQQRERSPPSSTRPSSGVNPIKIPSASPPATVRREAFQRSGPKRRASSRCRGSPAYDEAIAMGATQRMHALLGSRPVPASKCRLSCRITNPQRARCLLVHYPPGFALKQPSGLLLMRHRAHAPPTILRHGCVPLDCVANSSSFVPDRTSVRATRFPRKPSPTSHRILSSSVVERSAVNRLVVGSSPTSGATA